MAFGPDGNLYISGGTFGGQLGVRRYNPSTGAFIDFFANTGNDIPLGLAFGPDNNLYVATAPSGGAAVMRFNYQTGASMGFFVPPGSGGLTAPYHLTFDAEEPVVQVQSFAGQNWLITPAATAADESPPRRIQDQKWLLVLSGVAIVNIAGNNPSDWLRETVLISPDLSGPLHYAINKYAIPTPFGIEGLNYFTQRYVRFWPKADIPYVAWHQIGSDNRVYRMLRFSMRSSSTVRKPKLVAQYRKHYRGYEELIATFLFPILGSGASPQA